MKIQIARYEDGVLGLPGRAMVFSQSDEERGYCPRRWFYDRNRASDNHARPLRYGTWWHEVRADMSLCWMETGGPYPDDALLRCWSCDSTGWHYEESEDDGPPSPVRCGACEGTGVGPIRRAWRAWLDVVEAGHISREQAESDVVALRRNAEAYLHYFGRLPPEGYEVVGVEVPMATPVLSPSGSHYTGAVPVVQDATGMRLADEHDNPADVQLIRMPWYQVCRLDVVYRTASGLGFVGEFKSTSSAVTDYVANIWVDRQVYRYALALDANRDAFGIERVAGWMYEVSSSKQIRRPDLLKPQKVKKLNTDGKPYKEKGKWVYELGPDGKAIELSPGLSQAGIWSPSWIYEDEVREQGFDPNDYREMLGKLVATVDSNLFHREPEGIAQQDLRRAQVELYSEARAEASRWRGSVQVRDADDLAERFPRHPVCRMRGGAHGRCDYVEQCVRNMIDAGPSVPTAPKVRWLEEQPGLGLK